MSGHHKWSERPRRTPPPRNPSKREPGKTRDALIYEHWQRIRRNSFYWNGDSWYRRDGKWYSVSPLMEVARRFKMPIRELRAIIAAERARRHP